MGDLHQLIAEMRRAQAELAPILERYNATLWANRRTEGPQGFVMVRPAARAQPKEPT